MCHCCSFTAAGAAKASQAVQEAAHRHAKLADIGATETDALKAMARWIPVTNEPRHSFVQTPEQVYVMSCMHDNDE